MKTASISCIVQLVDIELRIFINMLNEIQTSENMYFDKIGVFLSLKKNQAGHVFTDELFETKSGNIVEYPNHVKGNR